MQILIGNPMTGTEAVVLRLLYEAFVERDGLILANFHVGTRQIDYVMIARDHSALIELKSVSGAVFGGQNGDWSIRDFTGQKREYPGFNPWSQANAQTLALSDEMSRFQKANSNIPQPLNPPFYREFDTFACIYPAIHPDSEIEVTRLKAEIVGYDELISALRSRTKRRSWRLSDWERFAQEFLKLQPSLVNEAISPRVHKARSSVDAYLGRLRDLHGHRLAPLPETGPESNRGRALITRLMETRNCILVGPSGSCKSFHLRHLLVSLASDGKEVPILADPKGYMGGDFSRLLQQSASPFTRMKVDELLGDISACGLQPVLVVDALNECPEMFRAKLLEKIQAFVVHFAARLVIADQGQVELAPEIRSDAVPVALPEGDEKMQIFAYYAGLEPTDMLSYLSRSFTNAFDLQIAGKCHARGDDPNSRWELYGRYVRDSLKGEHIVASAFLRAIAGEMTETLSMSIGRDRFEALAESFYSQEEAPLSAIQSLLESRLILAGDRYIWFEHELLLDFFKAQYLWRKADSPEHLANALSRPRNRHLVELMLPQCSDATSLEAVLAKTDDTKTLGLALRGRCGPLATATVQKHCLALLDLGAVELSRMKMTCESIDGEDGRKRLVGFNIIGNQPLSEYGILLSRTVAENLGDGTIQKAFLNLLELTDTRFLELVRRAAQEAGIGLRGAYSEALRSYGGLLHYGHAPFVSAAILSAIRYSRMDSRPNDGPLPILGQLVSTVRTCETRYFSFFMLLIDLQHDSTGPALEDLIDLADRGWKTGVGWLRTESVRLLSSLHLRASTLGKDSVGKIRTLLQSFETKDILVNTDLLEALAAYDGFERPVSEDDALSEMQKLIEATDEPNAEQLEFSILSETTWPQYRRDAAYAALGKIFEDIFQGAYYDAYQTLSVYERKKLLELAAMTSRPGFHIDWIMWELVAMADAEGIPVFDRFVTKLDEGTAGRQEVVGAFLAGVRGYARLSNQPPAIPQDAKDDRRAWAIVGTILFWWMKGSDQDGPADEINKAWRLLQQHYSPCFADILHNINHSQWQRRENFIDLATLFPDHVRPLLENAVRCRESLTSLFQYGGSADPAVLQTAISTLGKVGTGISIEVLNNLAEDPKFGRDAVHAIQAIRNRL
jgi:Nuclease-related domain